MEIITTILILKKSQKINEKVQINKSFSVSKNGFFGFFAKIDAQTGGFYLNFFRF